MRLNCPYPHCGASLDVPNEAAGEVLSCPSCGRKFRALGLGKVPSAVATPAAYGLTLFVAAGKILYTIDLNTQEVYLKQDLEAEIRYGLLIADGKLFVATKGGKILAFEP